MVPKGIIVPARGPSHFGVSCSKLHPCERYLMILILTYAGWDAIFEYGGETYAEMGPSKKNGLSHRYLALKKMKEWFIGHME